MSNKLFVVSAPAGTGKTTLVEKLTKEFPRYVRCITFTTRLPRKNESHKEDYHFISEDEFSKKIENDEFLEYAKVFDYYYGTCKVDVKEALKKKNVILVIDTQGAMQLKEKVDAIFIFIKPPNIKALKDRLEMRKTEDEKEIEKRIALAENEIFYSDQYDYIIINDDFDKAYKELKAIVVEK